MNLPNELIDKIIDEVWGADHSPSHTTTKAASLISRAWVERSQHHLFHSIEFFNRFWVFKFFGDPFGNWCNAVTPGPDGVSRHVRSLTIEVTGSAGWWMSDDIPERVFSYFDSFRNVQVLRVSNWNVEPFPPETLARCFTPFAEGVRSLQWDPHVNTTHHTWTRIIGLFPLVDSLLVYPSPFLARLAFSTPTDTIRKKLVCSTYASWYLMERNLRFQEIHLQCAPTTLKKVIAIIGSDADRLEILSLLGACSIRIDVSNTRTLTSFLGGCHALRELWIDWYIAEGASELHLIDAIPGGCVQSLRILPTQILWPDNWAESIPEASLRPSYEGMAQAILRLGTRTLLEKPGRKISVWFAIPQVPYVMCDPIRDSTIALWEAVERDVSFGFQTRARGSLDIEVWSMVPRSWSF